MAPGKMRMRRSGTGVHFGDCLPWRDPRLPKRGNTGEAGGNAPRARLRVWNLLPWRDPHLQWILLGNAIIGWILWASREPGHVHDVVAAGVLAWLSFIVLYPLLEEWCFRGVLQGTLLEYPVLRRTVVGLSLANGLVSLAFVGLHTLTQPPLWAMAVLFPSLVLGHMRERHGRLAVPMVLHVVFNATFMVAFATAR